MPLRIVNRRFFNGGGVVSAAAGTAQVGSAASASPSRVSPRPAVNDLAVLGSSATINKTGGAGASAGLVTVSAISASVATGVQTITHGSQLTSAYVGPWALQGTTKGSESLLSVAGPSRGYWRFDAPDEFSSSTAWPSNANDSNPSILNNTSLHYGTVTGSPVTIDGFSIPVGTRIVQFVNLPDGYDFLCQDTSLKVLFRGCRFRWASGVGGSSIFNDNGAPAAQRIMMHWCDVGYPSTNLAANATGLMHWKMLGGQNHRVYRTYSSITSTHFQPNTQGCEFIENLLEHRIFPYGESGTSGAFDNSVLHLNGISCEGGLTSIKILRNKILCESPDVTTGTSGGTNAGQVGYGLLPAHVGYGSGTNPGRLTGQTDCIALFTTNGLANVGDGVTDLQIKDNYCAGSGVPIYAGNNGGGAKGVIFTGNRIGTEYWTDGGLHGPLTDIPAWGTNRNVQSDNLWANDYGTGGNGCTALANRQYPLGNGPRAGTSFA